MLDIDLLIKWLGTEGAIEGLLASDLTVQELLELAPPGAGLSSKAKRADIIKKMVHAVREALIKSPEELMQLSADDLREYLVEIKASRVEILGLLEKMDIRPGSIARNNLIDFAAREISDIGMYKRVARGDRPPSD